MRYGILLHQDNAFEIAVYEDVSVTSIRGAIAAATFINEEPRYIVFDEETGTDPWTFLSKAELDAQYRYSADKINTEVVRLIKK